MDARTSIAWCRVLVYCISEYVACSVSRMSLLYEPRRRTYVGFGNTKLGTAAFVAGPHLRVVARRNSRATPPAPCSYQPNVQRVELLSGAPGHMCINGLVYHKT